MAAERFKLDENSRWVVGGVTNDGNLEPRMLRVDPTTNRLLVDASLASEDIPATGITDAMAVQIVDGSGNQITSFGGGTQYTESDTDASITGTAMLMEGAANTLLPVQGTVSDGLLVNLGSNNDVSLNAGTNAIGKLAANSGVDIGDVDVTSSALPTGASTEATLAAINAKLVSGTVIGDVRAAGSEGVLLQQNSADGYAARVTGGLAHDAVDGGSPVKIGGYASATAPSAVSADADRVNAWFLLNGAQATVLTAAGALIGGDASNGLDVDVTRMAALVAGTAAIGKLAANSGVDIGDVDVTSVSGTVTTKGIPSDIDINGANTNHADKYYTSTGAVTDGIVWSPAAGKRWHITTLYINVSAAATVTLEDDLAGGDVVRWKGELAANSGVAIPYDKEHPFSSGEDAADLIITTSAGNVYVQAVGYEI